MMTRTKAESILGYAIRADGSLDSSLDSSSPYIDWNRNTNQVDLDGMFEAEQLEAIAWWMKNHGK